LSASFIKKEEKKEREDTAGELKRPGMIDALVPSVTWLSPVPFYYRCLKQEGDAIGR
jgi:hypothetical protein